MIKMYNYIILILLLMGVYGHAQQEADVTSAGLFTIRGSVIESDTYNPLSKVNIEVNGGSYTTTDKQGEFRIQAKKGDELVIRHSDFETVYYTIKSNERITIKVNPSTNKLGVSSRAQKVYSNTRDFRALIDSADAYLKTDAEKSIQFLADALTVSTSVNDNAIAYETLADVYFEWKQYDLAVSNYRISLQNKDSNEVKLKLAESFRFNKNYQESIDTYEDINKDELSNWQITDLFEGLGDVFRVTKDYNNAIANYKLGLDLAQKHMITSKITDLNSKIAQSYGAMGSDEEAEDYFEKSLNLAEQENTKRAIEEKVKVADFQNSNQAYDDEIKFRQEALESMSGFEMDTIINESPFTPQKQNYKIGNAYYLQKDYNKAIPYLEKSIEEADAKKDLIVKKDATRKLSEVYRDAGNIDKALMTNFVYESLVDEIYIKKEQEIAQAARFRQDLSDKQSRISSLESDRALSSTIYELSLERNKRQQLIIYSLTGGLLLFLVAGYFMYKSIKQQKLANNLLALKSLRSQMNPHFIFNALNSVNSFISSNDERTANKYLSDFSQLMRAVLENSEEDFIPLEKEIELLELYTKLEHSRFQDKFEFHINIENNVKINDFQIPPMLLQPYIENAVWHGLRYKKEKGQLMINVSQPTKDELQIAIIDDGIGRERSKAMKTDNQKKHNSKGLGNIKKRVAILNEMYKDKVDVFIDDYQKEEESGTKVVVTLKKD
ncbi:MAG: histidine kinase [Bacteroidia bacterium]|nr:histidine kinase [Bacteroidia bacterium]MBT8279791.1 histidine kinase [Bacteroidia bacterium]NNK59866.1 histidine kinase [Flavobacteriaceae bacterium]RZW57066.1 MAG: tetratricopeptide repeat protein [Flavobacteriaceae bacterium]